MGVSIENPEQAAAQIEALDQVQAATPRLMASGIVFAAGKSIGVQINGHRSQIRKPMIPIANLVSGEFLAADDREEIVIGAPLAESLNLNVGDPLKL